MTKKILKINQNNLLELLNDEICENCLSVAVTSHRFFLHFLSVHCPRQGFRISSPPCLVFSHVLKYSAQHSGFSTPEPPVIFISMSNLICVCSIISISSFIHSMLVLLQYYYYYCSYNVQFFGSTCNIKKYMSD